MSCSVWRQAAENVADSLKRGTRVIAQGRLKQRRYETKEGEKRTVVELDVDEIGPSLRNAAAEVTKNARSGAWGGEPRGGDSRDRSGAYAGGTLAGPGSAPPAPPQDPWGTPSAAGDGWGEWPPRPRGNSDEPPF